MLSGPRSKRMILAPLMLVMMVMAFVSGCAEIADTGPQVVSVTVTPSTLAKSDTGMTDAYFEVRIVTSGFETPVTDAKVFIQEINLEGEPQDPLVINGDTITVPKIAQSWFGGLEPGQYAIEVLVSNDVDEVRQANAATVTITE